MKKLTEFKREKDNSTIKEISIPQFTMRQKIKKE